jgi:hypothetical protein
MEIEPVESEIEIDPKILEELEKEILEGREDKDDLDWPFEARLKGEIQPPERLLEYRRYAILSNRLGQ